VLDTFRKLAFPADGPATGSFSGISWTRTGSMDTSECDAVGLLDGVVINFGGRVGTDKVDRMA
jgi:hypothetical protein